MIKYSINTKEENIAKVYARNLSISTKQSVEICNNIRGKPLQKAKKLLEKVLKEEMPIKYSRYHRDTAHRKSIGPGRYPKKAASQILKALKSAEANAQNKGLGEMVVYHISAHKAAKPWHFGRQRRRKMKRTHIEIVLKESKVSG